MEARSLHRCLRQPFPILFFEADSLIRPGVCWSAELAVQGTLGILLPLLLNAPHIRVHTHTPRFLHGF